MDENQKPISEMTYEDFRKSQEPYPSEVRVVENVDYVNTARVTFIPVRTNKTIQVAWNGTELTSALEGCLLEVMLIRIYPSARENPRRFDDEELEPFKEIISKHCQTPRINPPQAGLLFVALATQAVKMLEDYVEEDEEVRVALHLQAHNPETHEVRNAYSMEWKSYNEWR